MRACLATVVLVRSWSALCWALQCGLRIQFAAGQLGHESCQSLKPRKCTISALLCDIKSCAWTCHTILIQSAESYRLLSTAVALAEVKSESQQPCEAVMGRCRPIPHDQQAMSASSVLY